MPIANVALKGRHKEIVRQPNQLGAGGKAVQVTSRPEAGDASQRLELLTTEGALQAVSNRLFVVPFQNRAVHSAADFKNFVLAVPDLDGFSTTLHVVPATLEPVLITVRGIELFDKHVLHVGKTRRGSPG